VFLTSAEKNRVLLRPPLKSLLATIFAGIAMTGAHAQSARVAGVAGYLSEWAFSGTLSPIGAPGGNEFSGSVTWKHVGLCSHNGPQEQSAGMSVLISHFGRTSQIRARLALEGVQCNYTGRLSGSSSGSMDCAGAKGVPLTLAVDVQ
jgi:hypothetical protein